MEECIYPYAAGWRQQPVNEPCATRMGKNNSLYIGNYGTAEGTRRKSKTRHLKKSKSKTRHLKRKN